MVIQNLQHFYMVLHLVYMYMKYFAANSALYADHKYSSSVHGLVFSICLVDG